ncbi:MAG TPA: preprotein translocase subunit SecG [Steroidobacteraceae bacterium]|nr:preprotein translocase subunit SecG [Steroidobacteraceae bacterium]
MLRLALTLVQFFCAMVIILLVLIQRGKGADAGAGFGAGASGTVFGARGAGTALSRATAIFAAVFMANSLALAYVGTHKTTAPQSILDTAGEAPTRTAPGTLPKGGTSVPTQRVPTQTPPASLPGTPSSGAPVPGSSTPGTPATGSGTSESGSRAPLQPPSTPSSAPPATPASGGGTPQK